MMLANAGYALDIDRRLARKFLSAGADVDAKDDFGSTALIVAAQHRRADLVKLLLSKGADSSITNCRGESAALLLHIKN